MHVQQEIELGITLRFEANLMCYVWSCLADIPIHLPHDSNVLITI